MCCVFPWLGVQLCFSSSWHEPIWWLEGCLRDALTAAQRLGDCLATPAPFFPPFLPLCACFRHSVFSGQTAEGFLCSQGARWQGSRKSCLYCHRLKQLLLSAASEPALAVSGTRSQDGFSLHYSHWG